MEKIWIRLGDASMTQSGIHVQHSTLDMMRGQHNGTVYFKTFGEVVDAGGTQTVQCVFVVPNDITYSLANNTASYHDSSTPWKKLEEEPDSTHFAGFIARNQSPPDTRYLLRPTAINFPKNTAPLDDKSKLLWLKYRSQF